MKEKSNICFSGTKNTLGNWKTDFSTRLIQISLLNYVFKNRVHTMLLSRQVFQLAVKGTAE